MAPASEPPGQFNARNIILPAWYYRNMEALIMRTVSLKISPALDQAVEELARRRGVSKSAVIREAIERYLSGGARPAKGSFLALAKNLAGCVEGPPDLSSNSEHLEGYGK